MGEVADLAEACTRANEELPDQVDTWVVVEPIHDCGCRPRTRHCLRSDGSRLLVVKGHKKYPWVDWTPIGIVEGVP